VKWNGMRRLSQNLSNFIKKVNNMGPKHAMLFNKIKKKNSIKGRNWEKN
jgi:hypothetical protein